MIRLTGKAALTAVLLGIAATACGGRCGDAKRDDELPSLSFTRWSERTEVFAEHPPLVAGRPARFAVHLTDLRTFAPLKEGRAVIELRGADGAAHRFAGDAQARPGVFRVDVTPPAPGEYAWTLIVDAPGLADRHDLGAVRVHPDEGSARRAAGATAEPAGVVYLKEQQWTNEFATELAAARELRAALRLPATVRAVAGGEAVVGAPAAGRFTGALPAVGDRVAAGQTLGRLEPRLDDAPDRATLEADVAAKRAAVDAAEREKDRAERLVAARALPARRAEEAIRALEVARAELRAAEARLQQREQTLAHGGSAAGGNAFMLRAPIGGTVVTVTATPGAAYEAGRELFRIVRTDPVVIEVSVPAPDAARLGEISGLALELPGANEPRPLNVRRIRHAGVIDPETHALPAYIEVTNPGRALLIGQVATAVVYLRARERIPAVPASAVLTEAGRPVAFVQVAGERFERRPLTLGPRDGELVGVRAGLSPRDRVVTRGAYEVLLASAAKGLPAEGHVH